VYDSELARRAIIFADLRTWEIIQVATDDQHRFLGRTQGSSDQPVVSILPDLAHHALSTGGADESICVGSSQALAASAPTEMLMLARRTRTKITMMLFTGQCVSTDHLKAPRHLRDVKHAPKVLLGIDGDAGWCDPWPYRLPIGLHGRVT
jgi:hypothetical protein